MSAGSRQSSGAEQDADWIHWFSFYFISLPFRTGNIEIISQILVKDMGEGIYLYFQKEYVQGNVPGGGGKEAKVTIMMNKPEKET